jgi:hypothetical protein
LGRKYKQPKSKAFVMLEDEEIDSPAHKSLSRSALRVHIFFRRKVRGPLQDKAIDKEIKAPYSIIIEDTGICRQSVRNAIVELENKGFIDLVKQGGLKSDGRTSSVYKLSIRFIEYGKETFKQGKMKKEKGFDGRGFAKVHKTGGKYKK